MELLKKVTESTGSSRYGIAQALNKRGVHVGNASSLYYSMEHKKGIRLPLLAALFEMCQESGVTADEFMNWITEEFLG